MSKLGVFRLFLVAVAFWVVDEATGFAQSNSIYTYVGTSDYQWLGTTVVNLGDLNGDGTPDFLIGSPGYAGSIGTNAGMAQIYSGATGSLLHTLYGDQAQNKFGAFAVSLGDVNGDGTPDFAVTAPGQTYYPYPPVQSYVRVYSGSDFHTLYTLNVRLDSAVWSEQIGAGADVNHDGTPDLFVIQVASGTYEDYVYSGADGTFIQARTGGNVPYGVIGLGDVDGDGYGDYVELVGAASGTVAQVISGHTATVIRTICPIGGTYPSCNTATSSGGVLANVGDIDGDGVNDFAFGLSNHVTGTYAFVSIWSGHTGSLIRTITARQTTDQFGTAIAPAGDINGDGVPDVLISSLNEYVAGYSGATGEELFRISNTPVSGGQFGVSIANLGDIDQDRASDILIGDNLYSNSHPSTGKVALVSSPYNKCDMYVIPYASGSKHVNACF